MSSFEQLKAQALELDLSGADVAQYVLQQQNGEREERAREREEREREREERLAKLQAEKEVQLAQLAASKKPASQIVEARNGASYQFSWIDGLLYRECVASTRPGNQGTRKLVVPADCRRIVLQVAHESHSLVIFPTGRQKTKCDASNFGLGAVLLQYIDGTPHPVAFASRKLLDRERRYATTEKEALAIIFGVKKFDFYLRGKEFLLETDHKPLVYLQSSRCSNDRVMRWALQLQNYPYRIVHIAGRDNVGADLLSRCPGK
ncbi:hypothetical protein Pcinc_014883 [Petrolisthes cinctipes]|uniref:Reverse transcriptase RNase H-like domain-containing protein n=1 Tax=Petrolisthes cinctipes TaxID=88211 RepID=A0AAE1FZH1_PETCI|nr:hypothetical protein Pcinc_014883 [Petrolisthes cinctipes]